MEDINLKNAMEEELAINGLNNIKKIKSIPGQKYCVIAYFLIPVNEINVPENKIQSRGLWYLIGTYSKKTKADEVAINLIKSTGIKTIYSKLTCKWNSLDIRTNNNGIKYVDSNEDKLLKDHRVRERKDIKESYLKQEEMQKEINEEQENEMDHDSIEYYTRQWYLTIKSRSQFEEAKKNLDTYEQKYNNINNKMKELILLHPEYEKTWLNRLETRLEKRGETNIFEMIKEGHNIITTE